MRLFSLTQEIAIDLGTANTIIISDDEIVVDEPSVVAIRESDEKMMAVGKRASMMQDRGESKIRTVRPLQKGVIADYKACEMMIRGLISLIPHRRRLFSPAIKMVVCVPSGATDAEIRTINDSCMQAGARDCGHSPCKTFSPCATLSPQIKICEGPMKSGFSSSVHYKKRTTTTKVVVSSKLLNQDSKNQFTD